MWPLSVLVLRFIQDLRHPGLRSLKVWRHLPTHSSLWGMRVRVINDLHITSIVPVASGTVSVGLASKCLHVFPTLVLALRGLAGGTWFSFSTLSTSVDDPLSRSQELSHLPDLTIPPPRRRTPDWALRRFPCVDLSKTCSDFHGHPMARNVGRSARDTLLTDSSLPYLSARTKFLTWALSGEVLLAI